MRLVTCWNFQYVVEMLTGKYYPLCLQYLDLHGAEEQPNRKFARQRDLRIHDRKLPLFQGTTKRFPLCGCLCLREDNISLDILVVCFSLSSFLTFVWK